MYIRSLTWVYCICHQVYCISYHVNQEPHLVYCICQQVYCIYHHVPSKALLGCAAETIMYIRNLTWVYCICHQVYCISYHVNQEPHLVYCICQQVYCIYHHVPSKALLGCAAFAIKCTAEAIMYIRSLFGVYCICNQVDYISYHIHQKLTGVLHLLTGALHLPSSVVQRQSCTSRASHQVYCSYYS